MVDFNLLGRLSVQASMVLALHNARTHRRVLVVARDIRDLECLHRDIIQRLEPSGRKYSRPSRTSSHTESMGNTLDIVVYSVLESWCEGQGYDLVWFRYLGPDSNTVPVHHIRASCRLGYNPLILWGDVPKEFKDVYESAKVRSDAGDSHDSRQVPKDGG